MDYITLLNICFNSRTRVRYKLGAVLLCKKCPFQFPHTGKIQAEKISIALNPNCFNSRTRVRYKARDIMVNHNLKLFQFPHAGKIQGGLHTVKKGLTGFQFPHSGKIQVSVKFQDPCRSKKFQFPHAGKIQVLFNSFGRKVGCFNSRTRVR